MRTLPAACATLAIATACAHPAAPAPPPLASLDAARAANAYAWLGSAEAIRPPHALVPGVPGAVACPGGGWQRLTFLESGPNAVRAAWVLDHCVVADSTGQRWTFTTVPAIDGDHTMQFTDTVSTIAGTSTGTLRIASGPVLGTCRVEMRYTMVTRGAAHSTRLDQAGTFCGRPVHESVTSYF